MVGKAEAGRQCAAGLQRLDRSRKDKWGTSQDWTNPNNLAARIARMKDGTTHLAHKAEHAGNLETEAISWPRP